MKQFIVHLGSDPKKILGEIGSTFGKYGINIITIAGTSSLGVCTSILIVDNEDEAVHLLKKLDIVFSTQDIILVTVSDIPGSLGRLFNECSEKGNFRIISFCVLRFHCDTQLIDLAITVPEEDYEKASKFLRAYNS